MTRTIAVTGASGYVGRLVCERLAADGHHVVAIGRHADRLPRDARIERREADVTDAEAIAAALLGADAAYYLVHTMTEGGEFADRDRTAAATFASAAKRVGVSRIVYLGGLGSEEDASKHLSSRHEVGDILRNSGVPVVEFRAAVVLGAGSISFEMLRYLTERLPFMVCPRWVDTRLQPIAERDLLRYLTAALDVDAGIYEIGAPDETTYLEMIQVYAEVRGLPRRRVIKVPLLTPRLSGYWVDLVTPVDRAVSHSLVESLRNHVVVEDPKPTEAAFDVDPLPVMKAIKLAVDEQVVNTSRTLFERTDGLSDGIYTMRREIELPVSDVEGVRRDLRAVGGDVKWYGAAFAWQLRRWGGHLFGEHLSLQRPRAAEVGVQADWWTIAALDEDSIVLVTQVWPFGEAWLGYRVTPPEKADAEATVLTQVAAFRPRGALGLAYWRALWPVHRVVFGVMARTRATRAVRAVMQSA
jgi:uncharacterized protein YbjT (DUF2867 family)